MNIHHNVTLKMLGFILSQIIIHLLFKTKCMSLLKERIPPLLSQNFETKIKLHVPVCLIVQK